MQGYILFELVAALVVLALVLVIPGVTRAAELSGKPTAVTSASTQPAALQTVEGKIAFTLEGVAERTDILERIACKDVTVAATGMTGAVMVREAAMPGPHKGECIYSLKVPAGKDFKVGVQELRFDTKVGLIHEKHRAGVENVLAYKVEQGAAIGNEQRFKVEPGSAIGNVQAYKEHKIGGNPTRDKDPIREKGANAVGGGLMPGVATLRGSNAFIIDKPSGNAAAFSGPITKNLNATIAFKSEGNKTSE